MVNALAGQSELLRPDEEFIFIWSYDLGGKACEIAAVFRIGGQVLSSFDRYPEMTRLETGFGQLLDTFVECFRKGDCRRPFPSLREAMTGLDEGMRKTRDTGLLIQQDLDGIRHILEITNRYQSMADALE